MAARARGVSAETHPGFTSTLELLHAVCLAPDGSLCARAEWEDMALAESVVHRERQRYLEGQSIYEELLSMIEDDMVGAEGGGGEARDADLAAVRQALLAALHSQRVTLPRVEGVLLGPGNEGDDEDEIQGGDEEGEGAGQEGADDGGGGGAPPLSALGLNAAWIGKAAAAAAVGRAAPAHEAALCSVVPELEKRLALRCKWLSELVPRGWEARSGAGLAPLAPAEGAEGRGCEGGELAAEAVAAMANRSRQAARVLQGAVSGAGAAREEYHRALGGVLSLLERILGEHAQQQAGADLLRASWLCARCRTMYSKLRVLEQRIVKETYSAEAVQALQVIGASLEGSIQALSDELAKAQSRVQLYGGMDVEYAALVEENARLAQLIRQREWTLAEVSDSM